MWVKNLLERNDLTGFWDRSLDDQNESQDIIVEYASIFTLWIWIVVKPPWLSIVRHIL